jgi:uncharacterized protein DUF6983
MSLQVIPTTSKPNQSFKTTVTVDGSNITLQFNIGYNEVAGYWVAKITDPLTGVCLVDSLPLVSGPLNDANLLSQHTYLRIGSMYLVDMSGVPLTDANLGTDFILAWGDNV